MLFFILACKGLHAENSAYLAAAGFPATDFLAS